MLNRTMMLLITLCVFLLLPNAIFAYQQAETEEVIKLKTELVIVDAQVLNKKTNTAFAGLKKEDFEIYEDGVKQSIESLGQDQMPLSVLMLIDLTVSYDLIREVRNGAVKALGQLKPTDEIAFLVFTDRSFTTPFIKDKDKAIEVLDQTITESPMLSMPHHPQDAILDAAKYMQQAQSPAGRRVIVMVSPGVANVRATKRYSRETVENELLESGSMFCVLTVAASNKLIPTPFNADRDPNTNPVCDNIVINGNNPPGFETIKTADIYAALQLEPFCDLTGGLIINGRSKQLEQVFLDLVTNLRALYTISYTPNNSASKKRYRQIKVKMVKSSNNLVVKARKGYYSENK